MLKPPIPEDEPDRLNALRSLGLLHTPAEERFDRITRMATRLLDAPIALVSFVAGDEQWFKSVQGLDTHSTSRDVSFCGHAIVSDGPLIVEDALADERFRDNPLVVNEPNFRFYAGQPLHAGGHRVGTVCVVDREPRRFSPEDAAMLSDLAAVVESEIQRGVLSELQAELLSERDELQRKAMIDPLTRLWNRGAIMEMLERELARARRGTPVSVGMIDADHFKRVNDRYGHPVGDEVLRELASRIRGVTRDIDHTGRYGGEEFLVLLSDCDERFAHIAAERIRSSVAATPFATSVGALDVTVSIGIATFGKDSTPGDALVATVDRALYAAKHKGRNRVEIVATG